MSNQRPPKVRPSKTLSSRLMTMKFMQRAAGSTSPSAPQLQPCSADTLSSKRQKVSVTRPSIATPPSDQQLIRVASTEGEEKKEKGPDRLAEEVGETKWVLSTVNGGGQDSVGGLRIVKTGFYDIDQEAWRPAMVGRRSFGKFNPGLEKRQDGPPDKSSSSNEEDLNADGEEDSEESHDPADTRESIRVSKEEAIRRASYERHQRKQLRRAEKTDVAQLAEKRRSKEVKLNRLSSISGSGGVGRQVGGSNKQDIECYSCGERGHAKGACPLKGKRRFDDWHGGPVKREGSSLNY